MFFLFKLRRTQKTTEFCFRFSNRFLVSPIKLLPFFDSYQIVIHLCLARKALFQFFYSRLPQSFDQNTKQDTTLCSRVSSKKILAYSPISLSLYFYFKNVFGACSNQSQQKLNSRTAIFDVERKSASMFFQRRYGRNRKSHLYISYQEIINCSLQFLVLDRSNLALCSHTSFVHLSLFLSNFGLITQRKRVYF